MRSTLWFAILLAACGGPSAQATDPIVVLPKQPPQPAPSTAIASAPPEKAPPPKPKKPFVCRGRYVSVGTTLTYCFVAEPMTFSDAERRCSDDGGRLLTIATESRSADLHKRLGSSPDPTVGRAVWIGLEQTRAGKSRTWRWATGQVLSDASWADGEPNDWDGHEQCAEMLVANGNWNDTRCNLVQRYVCEGTPCEGRDAGHRIGGDTMVRCLSNDEKSFADAKRACASAGGHLATPRTKFSQEALRFAMGQAAGAAKVWIGLSDPTGEHEWRWSSGAPLDWAAWAPGEPNDFQGNERCAELLTDTWQWNDFDCGEMRPFVCESY